MSYLEIQVTAELLHIWYFCLYFETIKRRFNIHKCQIRVGGTWGLACILDPRSILGIPSSPGIGLREPLSLGHSIFPLVPPNIYISRFWHQPGSLLLFISKIIAMPNGLALCWLANTLSPTPLGDMAWRSHNTGG